MGVCLGSIVPNLPTDVGMYRCYRKCILMGWQSPHRRGDVPWHLRAVFCALAISPQTWGCTAECQGHGGLHLNLPTDVGMYRTAAIISLRGIQSPHRRGDVPMRREARKHHDKISPQTWGCTAIPCLSLSRACNLPTDVGMYRPTITLCPMVKESPHRRGDVPRT